VCLAQQRQSSAYWQTRDSAYNNPPAGGAPFTPSCTPSSNFLARTSGLTNPQKTNYDNLICGLETDSVGCVTGSQLIGLWVLAAPDSATSLLNLCSSSFTLVAQASIPFTINIGYTGNGSSQYLSTGLAPNASPPNLNSLSFGVYVTLSNTTANTGVAIGTLEPGTQSYIRPLFTGNLAQYTANSLTTSAAVANTDAKGQWVATRTTGSATALYLNSNTTPFASNGSDTSAGPPTTEFLIGATNNAGSPILFSVDRLSFAFVGNAITAANMALVSNRINTFAKFLTGYGSAINAY
jgi:hypothetical protein